MTPDPASKESNRILLVEDSEDTRLLLTVALAGDGWLVDEAADAYTALERLRENRYDVMLTDYGLPGMNGAELIREALGKKLLQDTRVVVVTAHPDPQGIGELEVIRKPLDLPQFLKQMGRRPPLANTVAEAGPARKLDLVLYVSAQSLPSARAAQAVRALIPDGHPDVHLTICDLSLHPGAGDEDNIVFTPTLVKRRPVPRAWILGDLTRTETLSDLLRTFGGDAPRGYL